MKLEEALAWLRGERSQANWFRSLTSGQALEQREIWLAQADAASTEQAYWVVRAYKENLLDALIKTTDRNAVSLGTETRVEP